jgi:sodium transport system ATP-binding protein
VIEAVGLRKTFDLPRGRQVVAVREATFSVSPGEVFGLLGPNGAGKTTLLRMLATIIPPTAGYCLIRGERADEAPDAIRRHIGFLSGNTRLYGRLTGRELLRYFGRLYGMADDRIAGRTENLIQLLDMPSFVDRRCDSLSTGQTQRVSIARVMLHEPAVLILDEPTLGLDIMTSRSILTFIRDARAAGHSVIFSTHYMTEAEQLCDRIGLIHDGEILALDTKENLYARTGKENLQEAFLALLPDAREAAS